MWMSQIQRVRLAQAMVALHTQLLKQSVLINLPQQLQPTESQKCIKDQPKLPLYTVLEF